MNAWVSEFSEGPGLNEAGIKALNQNASNEQRAVTTSHETLRVLPMRRFCRKTRRDFPCHKSVLDFIKLSSGTRASPLVLLDIGYDDPNYLPTVQAEMPPP